MSSSRLFVGSVSSTYSKLRPTLSNAIADRVIGFVAEKIRLPGQLMLDVGCGTGINTRFFVDKFDRFVGIDVSDTQISEAQKSNIYSNVFYSVGDENALPCDDSSVDLITVVQAAHWLDHKKFFDQCDRVLKPKTGVVAILGYTLIRLSCPESSASDKQLNIALSQFFNYLWTEGYWHEDRRILDRQFRDIALPYSEQIIERENTDLYLHQNVSVKTLIDHIGTWSSYREYVIRCQSQDLMIDLQTKLLEALPAGSTIDSILTIIYPWFLIMCRKQ